MNSGHAVADLDIQKTISGFNAAYETVLLQHLGGLEARSVYEIDLTEPFFGLEWGVAERNIQRQRWRWLSPRGQSHLFLKLLTDVDHLLRAYVHTAASGQVFDALSVSVNGVSCVDEGNDWGSEGALPSHWALVTRKQLAKSGGIAKITFSLVSRDKTPDQLVPREGTAAFAKSIAFSSIKCEPYSSASSLPPRNVPTLPQRIKTRLKKTLGL